MGGGGGGGAERGAERVEDHVRADDGRRRVVAAVGEDVLVADVDHLDREVEQHHAERQQEQRARQLRDQHPRPEQEHEGDAGGAVPAAAVGPAARACRAEGAGEAGDAEQPDGGLAEVPGRTGERDGEPAPERPEGREEEERHRAAAAQDGVAERAAEASEHGAVPGPGTSGVGREHARHHQREDEARGGEDHVDGAPAPHVGDQPGDDA
nr:hypothetical protein [Cellulomonas iranensis]